MTQALIQKAQEALEPFARRWETCSKYLEAGEPVPGNVKQYAITHGDLRVAAEVFAELKNLRPHTDVTVKG